MPPGLVEPGLQSARTASSQPAEESDDFNNIFHAVRLDLSGSRVFPGAGKSVIRLEVIIVLVRSVCDTVYETITGKGRQPTLPLHPLSTATSHHSVSAGNGGWL